MPLPNLELKSRQNGGGSYINGGGVQNDPGQTSYREQVRDRLQNTPRGGGGANNNDFKTAKIDLSLFGAASENGGGSSYYRPLSRSNMASQQRRTGGGGGANINGNGASNNSYANSNRASMSNMKRQIVFYNKTYVPSSSDGNNNNDVADDNNDVVTTSNQNHQRRTSHRLSVNNDANENDLLRLNNSRDFYSKNNDDYFQSKPRHRNRGNNIDGGGKNNVLVLDRINQLSIDNTNNNRRPEPMPRQRNNNNNSNTNMTNEQPMGSRPNSRQQNHRSSHQQPLKPLSQQQQQRQQNEAFETTRSTIRRQRVQSNSNGDVSDLIGGNDVNGDNEMFSYVIDHFKPPNNNNFENDVFGDERFEVESVRDNETPVPKPRKFMQQSQQTPLVPSKISLRYELADSSGQNNTADAINLRMRRSTNNRPITPRTGPFTSSRQVDYQ